MFSYFSIQLTNLLAATAIGFGIVVIRYEWTEGKRNKDSIWT